MMLNINIKEGTLKFMLEILVKAYNEAVAKENPSKCLALVNQGTGKMIETMREEVLDTSRLFVCVYSDREFNIDNQIGIFEGKKFAYSEKVYKQTYRKHFFTLDEFERGTILGEQVPYYVFYSGMIYSELFPNNEEVGIYLIIKPEKFEKKKEGWVRKSFTIKDGEKNVSATCKMTEAVSFEKVRFDLKNAGKIVIGEPGKATLEEIKEVLELAPEYLGLTQKTEKGKEKL